MHKKVGILGGTFDPIHLGHTKIAEVALAYMQLDRVDFLPTGNPPHKHTIGAGPKQRFEMVKLATKDLPWAYCSFMELTREGTIYTVDTLRLYKEQRNPPELFYIIGTDTLIDLPNWRNIEAVCTLCSFIVIGREGADDALAGQISSRLKADFNAQIHMAPYLQPDISSSNLREILKTRGDTSGLLNPLVRNYIDENGLYV